VGLVMRKVAPEGQKSKALSMDPAAFDERWTSRRDWRRYWMDRFAELASAEAKLVAQSLKAIARSQERLGRTDRGASDD
jgi:hypothetical protein